MNTVEINQQLLNASNTMLLSYQGDSFLISGDSIYTLTSDSITAKAHHLGQLKYNYVRPQARVSVYDKNGLEVFSAQAYRNDWRGTYKNSPNPLPAGSYIYRINLGDGSPAKEGWIYIQY